MEKESIVLTSVSKRFRRGVIGYGTLQRDVQSWWARLRGKQDPNERIGVKRDFWALKDISFSIKQGETVGLIGKNGAGKSTLLKILSRITAPTEGQIDLYGRVAGLLEVGTGFHPELTGRENVYLSGAILGMSKKEIARKMQDIIDFSEVAEFIDTPVKRYSSGMIVKLAFSVALHLDSEILILDEVLSVSDSAFKEKCLNALKEMVKAQNRTVICVSHNMELIKTLCSRTLVLNEGTLVFDGKTDKAIETYQQLNAQKNA